MPIKTRWNKINPILKLAVSIGLILILVKYVTPAGLASSFRKFDPAPFVIALLLALTLQIARATRWYWLIQSVDSGIRFRLALTSYLKGGIAAVLTPGQIGDISRVLFVDGVNWRPLTGVHFADKLYNWLAVFLTTLLGLALLFSVWFTIPLAALLGLSYIILFRIRLIEKPVRYIVKRFKWKLALTEISDAFFEIPSAISLKCLLLSLLAQSLVYFEYFMLIRTLNPNVSFNVITAVIIVLALTTLVTISVGGLGVRETSAILLFQPYGVSPAEALTASLFLFSLNVLLRAVVGLIVFSVESVASWKAEQ